MSSEAIGAIFLLVAASASVFAYLRAPRIWAIGGKYSLPRSDSYDFVVRVSFPTKTDAEKCLILLSTIGLAIRIEPTINGERWAIIGEARHSADGVWYASIIRQFKYAIGQCDDHDQTIVATASSPGAGTGFVLAT